MAKTPSEPSEVIYPMPYIAIAPILPQAGERRREAERRTVRALLTRAPQLAEGYRLVYLPHGAPSLGSHPELRISISHTEGGAVILLNRGPEPIGVDLERRASQVKRVAHKFLNQEEMQALERHSEAELLMHLLWSSKEAAFKRYNPTSGSLRSFRLLSRLELALEEGYWEMGYEIEAGVRTFRCLITYNEDYVLSATGDLPESFRLNKNLLNALV